MVAPQSGQAGLIESGLPAGFGRGGGVLAGGGGGDWAALTRFAHFDSSAISHTISTKPAAIGAMTGETVAMLP